MSGVLIVEDDNEIRELVAEMLADCGYAVLTASNGQEALDCLKACARPCVILLDLMMPVMDGWQLRAELLADPALADVPVVVVSGAADVQQSSASLRAVKVLTKPVRWPALLECVQAHC
jgi:CheY-like chemotaxis protein